MPQGVQIFTSWQMGKESTAGTAVAATREWYPDGTGSIDIDPKLSLYRGNRGTRAQLIGAATKGYMVNLPFTSNPDMGVAYDELPFIFGQLDGGNTGVGGAADKTWTIAPSMTGANNQEAYTIEVGDDNQFWEFEYGQCADFTLSASRDSMTQLQANWFGRQPTKTTQTAVTGNTAVRIPGNLWKVRFATAQSGLSGASDQSNFLIDWSVNHQTGLVRQFSQDGLAYYGQTIEAQEQTAKITLHVWSNATAVSQFYDKHVAQTVDFMQLKAIGPTLGGGTYIAQMQYAQLYTSVKPISAEQDGMNIYEITAETVYDATWATYFAGSVVCSIASIT